MVNVVESLVERCVLRQVDERWQLAVALDEVGVGVPENVVRMIEREIDRLDPLERRVIEAASVAGMEFSTAAVAAAVEDDPLRVEEVCALKGAGSAEVEASYLNARELVDRLGDESRRFPVLWGLWFVNYSRGHYGAAREAGQRLLEVAHQGDGGEQLLEAHHALWPTLSAMGQPAAAILHIERGLVLYDRDRHAAPPFLYGGHDPGVCCHYYLALTRWLLGYPDRAVLALHDALRLVEAQAHPLTTVNALWFSAWVHYQRGDREVAAATAHRAIAMSTEHGFTGWADAALPLTGIGSGQRPDTQALAELHRRLVLAWTGGRGKDSGGSARRSPADGGQRSVLRSVRERVGAQLEVHDDGLLALPRAEGARYLAMHLPTFSCVHSSRPV